jgi:hypothetical protein
MRITITTDPSEYLHLSKLQSLFDKGKAKIHAQQGYPSRPKVIPTGAAQVSKKTSTPSKVPDLIKKKGVIRVLKRKGDNDEDEDEDDDSVTSSVKQPQRKITKKSTVAFC